MNVFGDIMFFISEVTFFQTSRCIFVQPLHHENLVVWCAAASPRALLHYESLRYYGYSGSEHNVNMQKRYTEQISSKSGRKNCKATNKLCRFPSQNMGFLLGRKGLFRHPPGKLVVKKLVWRDQ